ncbi:hypothetical protein P8C59_007865 [Phyllachora maydis]|uniref:Uncharacterized protein n=1 Tax=Phyllachora maydis TaxID=1825666 RepID=A0AAD9MEM1_9PEZI|nr:hypothetical protein P8C59_007865 [Phyllachora maydis]
MDWQHTVGAAFSVLSDDYQHGNIVESYFARSLGFSQLTIGLMLVVLSGSLPLTSVLDSPNDAVSPYAAAVILVSMAHHATAAFYTWARFHSSGQTGFMLGCIGNTVFAAYALWVLMFGSEKVQISRRTGANKRTSGWPFKNAEADKRFADKRNR